MLVREALWQAHRLGVKVLNNLLLSSMDAFALGQYGIGTNRSCLVYTTFSNRILVYYNIQLKSMSPSNLLLTMAEKVRNLYQLFLVNC